MPISAFDQALLRGETHIVEPRLNFFPKVLVAEATVFETPSLYPIGSIEISNIDSRWDDVKTGMLVEITETTGELVATAIVRLPPTDFTLFIDGKARGDAGRANRLLRAIAGGQKIRIYSFHPLYSLLSRINDGQFFKNFDVPYTDEGDNPDPVCNLGDWIQVDGDDDTGEASITLTAENSFSWLDRTILGYAWEIPDVATITSGTEGSESLTATFPAGFHTVYCTILDSAGNSKRGMRPIWVNHPTLYPSIDQRFGVEIESDSQSREGRSMSFRVHGDITQDDFIEGGAVIFTSKSIYDGGQQLTSGTGVETYVGFISQETMTFDDWGGEKSVSFETKSPYQKFSELPMVSQAIVEVEEPSDWPEVAIGLGEPNFVGWYILNLHTTYPDMFDYDPFPEDEVPQKRNWGLNGSNVQEYVAQCGRILGGYAGSTSNGTITFRRDPLIEENSFRDALDVRIQFGPDDITEKPNIVERYNAETGEVKAFAFAYDGSDEPIAVAGIAPGYVQGQAIGKQQEETILVGSPGTAQDKINRVAGHYYAKANNPTKEIQLVIARNIDVAEPINMLWYEINIPSEYDPRGEGIDTRALVNNVERAWEKTDQGVWLKRITLTFEPESFGQPGETYIIDTGGGSVYPPIQPPGPEVNNPFADIFDFVAAFNSNGDVGITVNGENWRNIKGNSSGTSSDMAADWSSPYIRSGFSTGAMRAFMVTTEGATVRVYKSNDILNTNVTWTQQTSYVAESDVFGGARILTYRNDPNHITLAFYDDVSVKFAYSLDGGGSWSGFFDIGERFRIDDISGFPLGADMEPDGTLVISGLVLVDALLDLYQYNMFHIPKGSSTEVNVDNSVTSDFPYPAIKVDRDGSNGYAAVTETEERVDVSAVWNYLTFDFDIDMDAIERTGFVDEYLGGYLDDRIARPPNGTVLQTRNFDVVLAEDDIAPPGDGPEDVIGYDFEFQDLEEDGILIDVTLNGAWTILDIYVNITYIYFTTSGANWRTFLLSGLAYDVSGFLRYEETVGILGFDRIANPVPTPQLQLSNLQGISRLTLGLSLSGSHTHPRPMQYGVASFTVNSPILELFYPAFFRFSNYKTPSSVFTDITPDGIYAPFHHYGVSIDYISPNYVGIVADDGSGFSGSLYDTSNSGEAWTYFDFVPYIGLHQIGNVGLFFGDFALDVTTDGDEFFDILGDWEESLDSGEIAVIRGVLSDIMII